MSDTVNETVRKTGGSRKGIPNKATAEARKTIALFVDGNAHRLAEWLHSVAYGIPEHDIKPNPGKAFELFQSVIEYHIPKLSRSELTGENGGPVQIEAIQRTVVDPRET